MKGKKTKIKKKEKRGIIILILMHILNIMI
jgi:hypothetical protein